MLNDALLEEQGEHVHDENQHDEAPEDIHQRSDHTIQHQSELTKESQRTEDTENLHDFAQTEQPQEAKVDTWSAGFSAFLACAQQNKRQGILDDREEDQHKVKPGKYKKTKNMQR